MAWIDDVVAGLQQQGASPFSMAPASPFPDVPQEATTEQQAAAAQAARDAAGERLIRANQRRALPFAIPDPNSAGVQLALDQAPAGTGMPLPMAAGAPDGSAFGKPVLPGMETIGSPAMPPSMQLATGMAGPVPLPQPRPADAPAATPTDLSSITRQAAAQAAAGGSGAPTGGGGVGGSVPPPPGPAALPAAPGAPVALPTANVGFLDRMKAAAPDFTALGAAWGANDWGPMQRQQQQERALQLQGIQNNATARLLQSRGATVPEIQAAIAGGSDTIKSLLSEYLGKDKWKVVQTGEDARGRKTFMQQNEVSGEVRPIKGNAAGAAPEDASDAAAAAGITGEDFLKTIPDARDRTLVQQLANYDLDPGKIAAKGGNRERLLALAGQYDPDFKPSLYAPRAAAIKEFTSGGPNAPASIITNGNTAIQHLGRMSELAERLGGTNKAWIANGLVNWANVKAEELKNNPDLAAYKAAEDRFVEEATKFYRGVGGNKSDIDRALSILTPGQSPEARRAAILEQAELMQSKINALQDRYKSAVGPSGWKKAMDLAGSQFPIVQQHSAEEMDKIRRRAAGEDVPRSDAAGSAPAIKPGKYVWDPKTGGLVPK